MLNDEERSGIKAAAGRLAWNNVWYYEAEGCTVFVLEAGVGRTLSMWHIERLVEAVADIVGPDHVFAFEGIEAIDPDTWAKMVLL